MCGGIHAATKPWDAPQRVGSVVLEANLIFHRDASLSRGDPSALNQPLGLKGGDSLVLEALELKVSSRSISSSRSLMKTWPPQVLE